MTKSDELVANESMGQGTEKMALLDGSELGIREVEIDPSAAQAEGEVEGVARGEVEPRRGSFDKVSDCLSRVESADAAVRSVERRRKELDDPLMPATNEEAEVDAVGHGEIVASLGDEAFRRRARALLRLWMDRFMDRQALTACTEKFLKEYALPKRCLCDGVCDH
jgi:hypothetical protein